MIKCDEAYSKVITLTMTQKDKIEYLRKILSKILDDRLVGIGNNKQGNNVLHPAFKTLLLCLMEDRR